MKLKRGVVGCAVVVLGLVTLATFKDDVTARERSVYRPTEPRKILGLNRKIARLQRRVKLRPQEVTQCSVTSCYAASESEAREKMLARISAEEDSQFEQELREGIRTEIDRYSTTLGSVMCSDGISDQEQIAIAAEMSTRLERWTLVTYRQKESIDRDNEVELAHQIIKKHLGETRYLDQAIKCAKSRDAAQVSAVTRGIEYLGAIVGLSAEQRAQTAAIWRKYSRLQGANEISLLDETGRLIQVGNDAALAAEVADESSTGLVTAEDSSLLELSEQFFSLLTPEQQRRYRAFIEENPGGAMSLMGLTIDPPEQIRATMSEDTSSPSDPGSANTQE